MSVKKKKIYILKLYLNIEIEIEKCGKEMQRKQKICTKILKYSIIHQYN